MTAWATASRTVRGSALRVTAKISRTGLRSLQKHSTTRPGHGRRFRTAQRSSGLHTEIRLYLILPYGVRTPGFPSILASAISRNTITLTGCSGAVYSERGLALRLRVTLRMALTRSLPTPPHCLRYNTYLISRDVRAARAGDLLFYHQPVQSEPFHTMLFVGRSYYQPRGSDWIVYHTGDIDGERGEIREVRAPTLLDHPDLHWRPLIVNPNFLGVYRLEILR